MSRRQTGAFTPERSPVIRSRLSPCPFFCPSFFSGPLLIACLAMAAMASVASAQDRIAGIVTDPAGAALTRVPVRLVDAAGSTRATALTDASGRFDVTSACQGCRLVVALPGFRTANLAVPAGGEVRLVLELAPVRETMVVTATRDEAPTSQVGAAVTVLDAAAIGRRGDALVGDLLRQAPGVTVVQNGGRGNVTSLFVRGGENNYTKVLLDGIPLNEPGGSFNFGGLTAGHVERIELVRGAQSALFGSDAMAGVVHLVTTRGRREQRPGVSFQIAGGGYGSQQAAAQVAGGTARADYALHASRYETDNRAPNNRLTSNTASFSAGMALGPGLSLRVVGRFEDGAAGAPGQTAFGRPDMDARFTQRHGIGGVTLDRQGARLTQRLTYGLATSAQRSTNLMLDAPYTPAYQGRTAPFAFFDFAYDSGSAFRRHHAGYQADLRLAHGGRLAGAEILTIALDWDGQRGTLTDHLAGNATSPARDNVGLTVQHQHVSARLAVTSGLRLEHNASFGDAVAPRVSGAVLVRAGGSAIGATKLKVNAGTGIKEPTLRQTFSLSPFDLGNPTLKAEESRTLDAGIEQRFLNDTAKVEAVWFDNVFRNQISTRTISFVPYTAQYINVGRTDARGLELVAEVAPFTGVRVLASHTVLNSTIIDASSEFSDALAAGRWALRRPRHSGQAQVLIDRGRLSADVGAAWTGRRNDSDFSSLVPALTDAPGYTLWRGQLAWQLVPQARVFVRVENLTDVEYMEPLGYPAWRRTVHAGLRVTF